MERVGHFFLSLFTIDSYSLSRSLVRCAIESCSYFFSITSLHSSSQALEQSYRAKQYDNRIRVVIRFQMLFVICLIRCLIHKFGYKLNGSFTVTLFIWQQYNVYAACATHGYNWLWYIYFLFHFHFRFTVIPLVPNISLDVLKCKYIILNHSTNLGFCFDEIVFHAQ